MGWISCNEESSFFLFRRVLLSKSLVFFNFCISRFFFRLSMAVSFLSRKVLSNDCWLLIFLIILASCVGIEKYLIRPFLILCPFLKYELIRFSLSFLIDSVGAAIRASKADLTALSKCLLKVFLQESEWLRIFPKYSSAFTNSRAAVWFFLLKSSFGVVILSLNCC